MVTMRGVAGMWATGRAVFDRLLTSTVMMTKTLSNKEVNLTRMLPLWICCFLLVEDMRGGAVGIGYEDSVCTQVLGGHTRFVSYVVPHSSCFERRNVSTCLEVSLQLHLQVDQAIVRCETRSRMDRRLCRMWRVRWNWRDTRCIEWQRGRQLWQRYGLGVWWPYLTLAAVALGVARQVERRDCVWRLTRGLLPRKNWEKTQPLVSSSNSNNFTIFSLSRQAAQHMGLSSADFRQSTVERPGTHKLCENAVHKAIRSRPGLKVSILHTWREGSSRPVEITGAWRSCSQRKKPVSQRCTGHASAMRSCNSRPCTSQRVNWDLAESPRLDKSFLQWDARKVVRERRRPARLRCSAELAMAKGLSRPTAYSFILHWVCMFCSVLWIRSSTEISWWSEQALRSIAPRDGSKIDCAAMIFRIRKGNHLNKNLHRRCKSTRTDQSHVSDRIHSTHGWCGLGSMSWACTRLSVVC